MQPTSASDVVTQITWGITVGGNWLHSRLLHIFPLFVCFRVFGYFFAKYILTFLSWDADMWTQYRVSSGTLNISYSYEVIENFRIRSVNSFFAGRTAFEVNVTVNNSKMFFFPSLGVELILCRLFLVIENAQPTPWEIFPSKQKRSNVRQTCKFNQQQTGFPDWMFYTL